MIEGPKMSGRSVAMLQKKLQELESELADVFRLPLDPAADDPRRQMPFDDIKKRFSFLTKLLAAEVDSHPQISGELQDIDRRLTQLKADFRHWNRSRTCFFNQPHDTLSICSGCTQAILQEDDDSGSEAAPEENSDEQSPAKVERELSEKGKYCGAFGCGFIVGAVVTISMAFNFFSSSLDLLQPPPT